MISDEMGKSMGSILSKNIEEHSVMNYCMPGLDFVDIVKKALSLQFSPDTVLILFCGRRGNIDKSKFIEILDSLTILNIKKVIICTFPYVNCLQTYENNVRYKLNNCLHTIAIHNKDKFDYIDTNIFINKTSFMGKTFNLTHYLKRQLARSLIYYIFLATPLARPGTVSIGQSLSDINLCTMESSPNNLN